MKKLLIASILVFASHLSVSAFAADDAQKAAAARYESDKKLCADEATSAARMQCLRDAKAEYQKTAGTAGTTGAAKAVCKTCGTVKSVAMEEKKGEGGPVGMIAGGVAGALLGNQIGSGTGRSVATVAGAAGGAYAGKKIEENVRTTKAWVVKVHMESGEEKHFSFDHDPGFKAGDPVKLSDGGIVRR